MYGENFVLMQDIRHGHCHRINISIGNRVERVNYWKQLRCSNERQELQKHTNPLIMKHCSILVRYNVNSNSNTNNNNNNNKLCSVLTILGYTFRLTPGCHGGNPYLFHTYVVIFTFIFLLSNHLYWILSKYLLKFLIWTLLVHLIISLSATYYRRIKRGAVFCSTECSFSAQLGYSPLTLAMTVRERTLDLVQNMNLYHCITFFPFVAIFRFLFYSKPKVKFMHSPSYAEHCRSKCTVSHPQNTTAHQPGVFFKCNTSVTGYKQGALGFPQL